MYTKQLYVLHTHWIHYCWYFWTNLRIEKNKIFILPSHIHSLKLFLSWYRYEFLAYSISHSSSLKNSVSFMPVWLARNSVFEKAFISPLLVKAQFCMTHNSRLDLLFSQQFLYFVPPTSHLGDFCLLLFLLFWREEGGVALLWPDDLPGGLKPHCPSCCSGHWNLGFPSQLGRWKKFMTQEISTLSVESLVILQFFQFGDGGLLCDLRPRPQIAYKKCCYFCLLSFFSCDGRVMTSELKMPMF